MTDALSKWMRIEEFNAEITKHTLNQFASIDEALNSFNDNDFLQFVNNMNDMEA